MKTKSAEISLFLCSNVLIKSHYTAKVQFAFFVMNDAQQLTKEIVEKAIFLFENELFVSLGELVGIELA